MSKEKMYIVASNVDDSIKAVSSVYEIFIVPTFVEFEKFIEGTPISIDTIIVSANDLPFTSTNMSRLINLVNSRFLKLRKNCIYLVDFDTDLNVVREFLDDIKDIIVCYQGDLSMQFISDIVDGTGRDSDETETEVATYRMRAKDYVESQNIKKYQTDENRYPTDEDLLSDVPPVEEPRIVLPDVNVTTNVYYVVGKNSIERSLFTFLEAQYLSLIGKVVFMESDLQYHTLSDMVTKSGVSIDFYELLDFKMNPSGVLERIKMSQERLIFIGCKNRMDMDYNFVYDVILSNLEDFVDYFVKECDFDQAPYGSFYNIVCGDTVPEVLECVNSLKYDIDPECVSFVGLRTRDIAPVNIYSQEMASIIQVLMHNDKVKAEVISAYGVRMRKEGFIYDLSSIIGGGNPRQN